jgi:predicted Holliday junction resolvase-like endonuclease
MIELVLFLLGLFVGISICYFLLRGRLQVQLERWKLRFEEQIRRDVLERSRATLKGRIGEQLAPLLPMFEYEPADARFLGNPVDYVVFRGLSEGEVEDIIFVDIKTGKSANLNRSERQVREVVEKGKVSWRTISLGEIASSD